MKRPNVPSSDFHPCANLTGMKANMGDDMHKMNFKRELGKQLMVRVVEPGMYTAAKVMSMSHEHEGEPVVEIFDTAYTTYVDRKGKAYGHLLHSEPLGDFIERLEENKTGIDLTKDNFVPQWGLSSSQCKRLLGALKEFQETYENDTTPGMTI
jgi:hypothetical protein